MKKKQINMLFLLVILLIFIFLPDLLKLYNSLPFINKVDGNISYFTRLNYVTLVVPFFSAILAFQAFTNTLEIQKEDRENEKKILEERKKEKYYNMTHTDFYNLLNVFSKVQESTDVKKFIISFKKEYNKNLGLVSLSTYTQNQATVTSMEIGHYLRTLHRILKTLNQRLDDNYIDYDQYHMFIGILRTQITAKEFFVIISNCIYSKKSKGMAIQMIGSGIFDDLSLVDILNIPVENSEKFTNEIIDDLLIKSGVTELNKGSELSSEHKICKLSTLLGPIEKLARRKYKLEYINYEENRAFYDSIDYNNFPEN
ncbi:putative phage abortive infection protein [Candidatus Enterococcus mansonii]|uniref:putative phage abortive infection protein n=1 Tax=Candidatus Enterococcus mansonii TaxID=1834181 RepID=UPI0015C513F2|nr:putative phage abortive infection protein [Enterococcus sp. 4G2_DIV0659]